MRLAKKMLRSAALPAQERFIGIVHIWTARKERVFTRTIFGRDMEITRPKCEHAAAFEKISHADFLNQMLYLDTKIFMTSLNLNYNDKMSMACSVEVRVPFLDHEFAEFVAWNVPPKSETERIFLADDERYFPQSDARHSSGGSAAPAKSGICGADRLLAGERSARR